MARIAVKGYDYNVLEKGKGTALVLLHGFPLDGRVWEAQVEGLSRQYRVIAPDMHGFGQSQSPDSFTMESLAEEVQLLLRHMGALPCVLGGLSMGGYVALAYEQMCPMDLKGLVLVDTKAEGDSSEAKANRQKMIELVRTAGTKAVVEQMMPKMVSPQTQQHHPERIGRLRQIMESVPAKTIENAQRALRDRADRTSLLPSIAHPVLIIMGEHDGLTPPTVGEQMRQVIPHAQLAVIRDAGHMSPLEQPEPVNAALSAFLESAILPDA